MSKENTCLKCNIFKKIYCKQICASCYQHEHRREVLCKACARVRIGYVSGICVSCYNYTKYKEKMNPEKIEKCKKFLEENGYKVEKVDGTI